MGPIDVMKMRSKEIIKGIRLRAAHLEKLTVSFVELDADAVLPEHTHPHEQITYIAKGILRLTVNGNDYDVAEGQVLPIPANAPHSGVVIQGPVFAIDSFSPRRDDYVF